MSIKNVPEVGNIRQLGALQQRRSLRGTFVIIHGRSFVRFAAGSLQCIPDTRNLVKIPAQSGSSQAESSGVEYRTVHVN